MENEKIPRPGEFYKHFKGKLYQIITVATHSETGESMVVYQALYGDFKTYVRPLEMFVSKVDHIKYPSVLQEYRFQLQRNAFDKANDENEDIISIKSNDEVSDKEQKAYQVISDENSEHGLNPNLLMFLDAETYQDKLNILVSLKNKLNDRLLDDIATSMDIIFEGGTLEERYQVLRDNLLTLNRFECNRLR